MKSAVTPEVLEALKNGDQQAFETIFIAYFTKIKVFICQLIKSEEDAEELTLEIFVQLWLNRSKINTSRSFDTTIFSASRMAAFNYLIHEKIQDEYTPLYFSLEEGEDIPEKEFVNEISLLTEIAAYKISSQRQKVFFMNRREKLSSEEIAEKLQSSKKTVDSQLSMANRDIKKQLSLFSQNYPAEIVKEYLKNSHPEVTETKIIYWLTAPEHKEEKKEALAFYWKELHVQPDIFVYESLDQTRGRIGEIPEPEVEEDEKTEPEPIQPAVVTDDPVETDTSLPVIQLSPADVVETPSFQLPEYLLLKSEPVKDTKIEEPVKEPPVIRLDSSEAEKGEESNDLKEPEEIKKEKEIQVFDIPEPRFERMEDELNTEEENLPALPWLKIAAVVIPILFLLGIGGAFLFSGNQPEEIWVKSTVPYGERNRLELADGSVVWLNAGSSLEYPEQFLSNERRVRLTGEGYFLIEKDKKTFRVETTAFTVEAPGTEFNVTSYPEEEKSIVTLIQGIVQIDAFSNELYRLEPLQQLEYDNETTETVIRGIEPEFAGEWREGRIRLKNASLKEILKRLERERNIQFQIEDPWTDKEETYTIEFVNNETMEEILTTLQTIIPFVWRQENSVIFISN